MAPPAPQIWPSLNGAPLTPSRLNRLPVYQIRALFPRWHLSIVGRKNCSGDSNYILIRRRRRRWTDHVHLPWRVKIVLWRKAQMIYHERYRARIPVMQTDHTHLSWKMRVATWRKTQLIFHEQYIARILVNIQEIGP